MRCRNFKVAYLQTKRQDRGRDLQRSGAVNGNLSEVSKIDTQISSRENLPRDLKFLN
jgi:hypothetical protein